MCNFFSCFILFLVWLPSLTGGYGQIGFIVFISPIFIFYIYNWLSEQKYKEEIRQRELKKLREQETLENKKPQALRIKESMKEQLKNKLNEIADIEERKSKIAASNQQKEIDEKKELIQKHQNLEKEKEIKELILQADKRINELEKYEKEK